jgi:hypothetical protein
MTIEKDLELDLYHLDEAWLNLPQLTQDWNSKAVEAELDYLNNKQAMDDLKANYDTRMRENPGEYGISKITESALSAAVNSHPEVKQITQDVFELFKTHKRIKTFCLSLATKEKALNGLTKLYEAGYFASKPINAMASTFSQEKETSKLNTDTNKKKLIASKSTK